MNRRRVLHCIAGVLPFGCCSGGLLAEEMDPTLDETLDWIVDKINENASFRAYTFSAKVIPGGFEFSSYLKFPDGWWRDTFTILLSDVELSRCTKELVLLTGPDKEKVISCKEERQYFSVLNPPLETRHFKVREVDIWFTGTNEKFMERMHKALTHAIKLSARPKKEPF